MEALNQPASASSGAAYGAQGPTQGSPFAERPANAAERARIFSTVRPPAPLPPSFPSHRHDAEDCFARSGSPAG